MSTAEVQNPTGQSKHKPNLAGFIVHSLLALLHVSVIVAMLYFAFYCDWQITEDSKLLMFPSWLLKALQAALKEQDSSTSRAANVYIWMSVSVSASIVIWHILAMSLKSFLWAENIFYMNSPMINSLVMTVISWYYCRELVNGIGWFWVVSGVLEIGLGVMYGLVKWGGAEYAYLHPWVLADCVPKTVV